MTTNIKFTPEEYNYLTKLSVERTGKKNIAGAIRIILMERLDKQRAINALEVIDHKTVR